MEARPAEKMLDFPARFDCCRLQGGTPIAGWFIRENPSYKWMMNRGTPNYGNPHIAKPRTIEKNTSFQMVINSIHASIFLILFGDDELRNDAWICFF